MSRPVCQLTVGPPRVGKSARVVRLLVSEFLPYEDGTLFTNLPLNVSAIADLVGPMLVSRLKLTLEAAKDEIHRRVQIIPQDVLEAWECEVEAGHPGVCPDAWLMPQIQPGDHIVLDEAHRYIPKEADKLNPELVLDWKRWVAELGHPGASLELISQDQWMISEAIRALAAVKVQLSSLEETRSEVSGFRLSDQWQLIAKWRRQHYVSGWREDMWVRANNKFEVVPIDGQPYKVYRFDPLWFTCYDSHSKKPGEEGGYVRKKPECERLSWPWFASWFVSRNFNPVCKWLSYPVLGVAAMLFFLFYGQSALTGSMLMLSNAVGSTTGAVSKDKAKETPTPPASSGSVASPAGASLVNAVASEAIDRLLWDSAIILMSERHVIMRNGSLIRVGEKVQHGTYNGRTIAKVDLARRVCQLDNGVVLQLSARSLPQRQGPAQNVPGTSPGQGVKASVAAGPGLRPEADPGRFGKVGSSVGSGSRLSPAFARPELPGAGQPVRSGSNVEGSGSRFGGPGVGQGLDSQGSEVSRSVVGRSSGNTSRGDDSKTADALRDVGNKPDADYIVPAKRQPQRTP